MPPPPDLLTPARLSSLARVLKLSPPSSAPMFEVGGVFFLFCRIGYFVFV